GLGRPSRTALQACRQPQQFDLLRLLAERGFAAATEELLKARPGTWQATEKIVLIIILIKNTMHFPTATPHGSRTIMSSPFLDKAFASVPAFRHADPDGLSTLADSARRMVLTARQHLFHLGEPADHFYWIETGSVTLYLPSYNGDERVFQVLEDG